MQLIARNISKSFGATRALDNVSITLESGKVRALVGENGAGKSTLFKVLAANVRKDTGTMSLDDKPYNPTDMPDAARHGVAMVFQEITINTSLGIAENIFIDRLHEFVGPFGLLNGRALRAAAQKILDEVGAGISVDQELGKLDLGQWKIIEIARALSYKPQILFLDESTAYLNTQEVTAFLAVIRRLKERGMAIGFVSHHLEEIGLIADTITILKDGKWVGDYRAGELETSEIEALMVGREIGRDIYPYQGHPEIKGVWCANGGTATGVMAAIKNAGKRPGRDIMVVAMDLNPENVEAVRRGELLYDIGGHWMQGGFALVMLYDALNDKPIPADQAVVKLDLLPITKYQVPQYEKEFANGLPAYSFRQHSRVYNPDASPAAFELRSSGSFTAAPAGKRVKIGAVVPTLEATFWNRYRDFMQKGADELGAELLFINADNQPDKMARAIDELIAAGVDGLIVVPYWQMDRDALGESKKANIPVIFTDVYSSIPPQSSEYPNYLAFVGPKDEEAGYQMALALFEATSAGADGKKHIGWVEGTPGTSAALDRNKGMERALAEHPEVVVAGRVNGNFVPRESQAAFEALAVKPAPVGTRSIGEPVLVLENVSFKGKLDAISLELCQGEILGIGGLKGSGGESILEVIYGEFPPQSGRMLYEGREHHPRRPYDAWEAGIAYLPGSRTTEGLIVDFTVLENLTMAAIPHHGPILDKPAARQMTAKYIDELTIKAYGPEAPCSSLSGGNLQKVVLGKCIAARPKVLLLNNPTRGIDVGARMEIYRIIRSLASQGTSIILLSEDLPELIGLSDRIAVTRVGRISKMFARNASLAEEQIISHMI